MKLKKIFSTKNDVEMEEREGKNDEYVMDMGDKGMMRFIDEDSYELAKSMFKTSDMKNEESEVGKENRDNMVYDMEEDDMYKMAKMLSMKEEEGDEAMVKTMYDKIKTYMDEYRGKKSMKEDQVEADADRERDGEEDKKDKGTMKKDECTCPDKEDKKDECKTDKEGIENEELKDSKKLDQLTEAVMSMKKDMEQMKREQLGTAIAGGSYKKDEEPQTMTWQAFIAVSYTHLTLPTTPYV